ncbi:nuclear transport factor 2 family protein [Gramella sp. AN32]|uniref:Nuclear transport factor 2 family protein n=1 Tax=Christiangramia antarctica TaxID=2058158 RepID=A0ABW5X2N7_9FLAO|nr:nuclear transport factor 2 family protein [Gramella sp. AN32]MCM4156633.1 DUF4440 domain-containing protein [Gramella sp. AN32]
MRKFTLIIGLFVILVGFNACEENKKPSEKTGEKIQFENRASITAKAHKEAVAKVMGSYKYALENLTTKGTFELFADSAKVYESGGIEGAYKEYIDHHLGPELGHFESFKFSDYSLDVEVDLPYAFTTETYIYTIILNKKDGEPRKIQKKGVATSILKKQGDNWKIIKTHSSSRNYNPKQ